MVGQEYISKCVVSLVVFLFLVAYFINLVLYPVFNLTLDVLTRCLHGAVLRDKLLSTDSALLTPLLHGSCYFSAGFHSACSLAKFALTVSSSIALK